MNNSFDKNYKCRWSSYGNYTVIVWVWMMNEITVMYSPSEISHNGYYFHGFLQTVGLIFIGIPLVYTEMCLAQYTNCDIFTMWDFFPFFRYVGLGTIFLILLKTFYLTVLLSWYLEYTFFAVLEIPPWYSCNGFNTTKCMVKSLNVSIFQHCLEAQRLFNNDCGMKTASYCFFEQEIGLNATKITKKCAFPWKAIIACVTVSVVLFFLSLRKGKLIQIAAKLLAAYICVMILIMFGIILSTSGPWFASTVNLQWDHIDIESCFDSITRGFLSVSTGNGIIIFLTRDVPFRSPATMTSISTSLFSLFASLMLALICFSGIKTMSFFHGEEENVVEIGESVFFSAFASVSEIMTYIKEMSLWGFCWYSSISFCLFFNVWILHLYLEDILYEYNFTQKYTKLSYGALVILSSICSWPFFCSDLTGALGDAVELIQIINNVLFSVSFYWIYGYHTHNVDIIFMIGIRASYFWKITWLLNPMFLITLLYYRWKDLDIRTFSRSYKIIVLDMHVDTVVFYIIVSVYAILIVMGITIQLFYYHRISSIRELIIPTELWGPRDLTLFKSRKLFVPEIMTTEFLYRQVRIKGYRSEKENFGPKKKKRMKIEASCENIEWTALTSN